MSLERIQKTYKLPVGNLIVNWNENVRTGVHVYDDEDFSGLKESIREHGIQKPLDVTHIKGTDTYKLCHGFRRTKAVYDLIESGFEIEFIPVNVVENNEEAILINHIVLNTGKPLTDLEMAAVLGKLESFGYNLHEIQKKTGVPYGKVSRLINFEKTASKKVKDAIADETMSFTAGCNLVGVSTGTVDQNEKLEKLSIAVGQKIKVKDLEKVAPKKYTPSENDITSTLVALEEVLGGEFEEEQIKAILIKMKEFGVKM